MQTHKTYLFFAKLVSNNNNLLNGMYLEASIKCDGFENVVKIPRKSCVWKQHDFHS